MFDNLHSLVSLNSEWQAHTHTHTHTLTHITSQQYYDNSIIPTQQYLSPSAHTINNHCTIMNSSCHNCVFIITLLYFITLTSVHVRIKIISLSIAPTLRLYYYTIFFSIKGLFISVTPVIYAWKTQLFKITSSHYYLDCVKYVDMIITQVIMTKTSRCVWNLQLPTWISCGWKPRRAIMLNPVRAFNLRYIYTPVSWVWFIVVFIVSVLYFFNDCFKWVVKHLDVAIKNKTGA